MLELDLVGIGLSWLLLGPRYPLYILFFTFFQETFRFLMAVALKIEVSNITAGGIFGVTTVAPGSGILATLFILYSGPLFCFLFSRSRGGLKREEEQILNPLALLTNPLGVIAWRFFLLSTIFSTWRILC